MATTYLEKYALYVQNIDNLVYKVKSYETYDGYSSLHLNLSLVGGKIGDTWHPAKDFDEGVQDVTEIQYFLQESMKECLEQEYEILDELPAQLKQYMEG